MLSTTQLVKHNKNMHNQEEDTTEEEIQIHYQGMYRENITIIFQINIVNTCYVLMCIEDTFQL